MDAAADGAPVIPSRVFKGAVMGYVFTLRDKVLGYHLDAARPPSDLLRTESSDGAQQQATSIRLEDVIYAQSGGTTTPAPSKKRHRKHDRASFKGPIETAPSSDSVSAKWWRHNGLWAVDTINPNSFGASQFYREASTADAAIMQETKAYGPAHEAMSSTADRNSWRIAATPAKKGRRNGRSGGAAILVRNCYSVEEAPGLRLPSEPHRAAFAKSSVCGGVVRISLYLHHDEGLSADNKRLLEEIAAEVTQINGPWIIGMDANMSPSTLEQSGWPSMINGHVVAPDEVTCFSSTYDYFVISKCLQSAVHGVQVINDTGINPHCPVRLLLHASAARRFRRRLVRPPNIPGRLPLGPRSEATQLMYDNKPTSGAPAPASPMTSARRNGRQILARFSPPSRAETLGLPTRPDSPGRMTETSNAPSPPKPRRPLLAGEASPIRPAN